MTSIQRALHSPSAQSALADSGAISAPKRFAEPFKRSGDAVAPHQARASLAATSRDRAIQSQSLDSLCQDVNSHLGADPFSFPFGEGSGMLARMGPNVIVCNGPDNFYVEMVNGRITNKQGQSDAQIATFLGAAKQALE